MISWTKLLSAPNDLKRGFENNGRDIKPVIVWNITSSCNLSCYHCYLEASKIPAAEILDTQKCKKIILDLADFGVPALLFSGGEPLLRKDIFELAEFSRQYGIRPVLSTNGTLVTESLAEKIKTSGIEYAGISIDGKPNTHDRLRGQKGSFKQAAIGIRNCKDAGVKIGVRFTLMKDNAKDLDFIFDFVRKEKAHRLCIYHLVYSGRGRQEKELSSNEKKSCLELIWDYANAFYREGEQTEILTVDNHCDGVWIYHKMRKSDEERANSILKSLMKSEGNQSGVCIGCIDYKGDVYIDQFTRGHSLGNVTKRKFEEIWEDQSNHLLYGLRHRKDFIKGRCKGCSFFSICNGNMRARAQAVYGDFWEEDPGCYLSSEEINADGYPADILGNYAGL